jgi:predicted aspartyl protease
MGVIGKVTADREARVPLIVRSGNGIEREIEAVVDTGFNGVLALPARHIDDLSLSLVGRERMLLASGDLDIARTYRAFVKLEDRVYSDGELKEVNLSSEWASCGGMTCTFNVRPADRSSLKRIPREGE